MIATLILVAAYLLGSLSGSLLLGRLRGVDIRTLGSGNAGGTNALRTQGWKFALGTVLVDLGKGVLAAWLALRFGGGLAWLPYAAAGAAVLGHVYPVFHGFRGGKGAGTLVGALLLLWPLSVVVVVGTWLLALTATGYVGLSTILAGLALVPLALLTDAPPERLGFAVAAAAFLVFTHRSNLARLRAGTESRFERVRIWARLRRGRA
ncbi:glycerol-3-phosphate 1-O-acyltransferase PlsY [Arenimonas caeni]|jgi:glycerol-3-phosphate acyltransferase PlsY|uniref:glycerol-3-phosphate 1-O-acyltransferase PlsY n=1 Tax=Arenimonas caeni TaxID=2058085 RepID=UPI002A36BC6D|nr:glycerol-3-phosphate 1-O-acyltransferase PlsY [Arenimonas caeni]MDY0021723.1 glycerol-3-phosphate 1-O-acyltransferase PlsY [Arenimonas caeni]